MRSFSKKLAFALAAAMVLTTAAPAAQAKAADDFTLNRTTATLYVNNGVNDAGKVEGLTGNVQKYDFNLKNKPADWKDYAYVWSSSNEKVATVAVGGVTTAVGVGEATITCVIANKATGETVDTLTAKVTVKANAAKVVISNAADVDGETVEVGKVVDLNRTMFDANGNKTSKRGTYVTDLTKWVAEPAAGVTIDQSNGKFTFTEAAAAGDYKLYCYTYQSDKYAQATATAEAVNVTLVKDTSFDMVQNSLTKFTINFDSAQKALGALTVNKILTVNGTDYELPQAVGTPVLASDGMSATIELFNKVADKEKYVFTLEGFEEPFECVTSAGAPKTIKVSADKDKVEWPFVTANTNAELFWRVYDAAGVDVTEKYTGNQVDFAEKAISEDGKYSVGGNTIWFEDANLQATVAVEFHTGEYDENGEEIGNVKTECTFYSQAAKTIRIEKLASSTILDGTTDLKAMSVPVNAADPKLQIKVKITDENDAVEITNGARFREYGIVSFEETNNNVFAIDKSSNDLFLFQQGKGQVIVYITDANNNKTAIGVVNVTVTEAKALKTVTLNKSTVTVGIVDGLDSESIKLVAKDNYGGDYDATGLAAEITPTNTLAKKVGLVGVSYDAGVISIDGSDLEAAFEDMKDSVLSVSLTYKIKVENKYESSFTVTVKRNNANASKSYTIEKVAGDWGDVSRTSDKDETKAAKSVTFRVYEMNNGVKAGTVDLEAYKDKAQLSTDDIGKFFVKVTKGGTDITAKGENYVALDAYALSGSAVTGSALSGTQVTLKFSEVKDGLVNYDVMGAGNYTITLYTVVKTGTTVNYRALRTVSGATTVNVGSYSYVQMAKDTADSASAEDLRACFVINGRDGKKTENTSYEVEFVDSQASGTVFVKSITFKENVGDADVAYKVTINKAVKVNAQ